MSSKNTLHVKYCLLLSTLHFLLSTLSGRRPVEAAGIEPASRDTSMQASTCVVEGLVLVTVNVYRQDFHSNQPELF